MTLGRRVLRLVAWIDLVLQIRRERNQLAGLSDHELCDIGITRAQADAESYRGLSHIPRNRLKPIGRNR